MPVQLCEEGVVIARKRVARLLRMGPLWVAEIAHVPTEAGCLCPAVLLDVWSRRITGRAMGNSLHTA